MQSNKTVYAVKLDDLLFEAVLDEGFFGGFSFSDEMHAHAYYELIMAVDGRISIEPAAVFLQDRQLCIVPPAFYHRIRRMDDNAGKLAVRFHCRRNGQGSLYGPFTAAVAHCRTPFELGEQPQLSAALLDLRRELQEDHIAREQFAECLLEQFFILLYRKLCKEGAHPRLPPENGESVRRLLIEEYLLDNFRNEITEQDLANHMHLSKRQVSRVLDAIYSKSFRSLLIEMRLREAAGLLKQTVLPIEQIAPLVGYTSVSGFCEAFRKFYGISAGTYRKKYKNLP